MTHTQRILARTGTALAAVAAPFTAFAAENPFNVSKRQLEGTVRTQAGLTGSTDLPVIIGNIINVVLGFMGILLLGYLLYAGFLWMTAGGSEDQVKKAKSMIQQAIIGLIIIVAAFAISTFVLQSLINVTQ